MTQDAPQPPAPPTPREEALRSAVHDIERHVAAGVGWDGPVLVFALVRTAAALAADPSLAEQLPPDAVAAAQEDPEHLTGIEQEGLPPADSLEELLAQLGWPEQVDGAAIVAERIVVPPEAETAMPSDPEAAVEYLMAHPDREDVRMAVGVLRSGECWCAVRARSHDTDDAVVSSRDAVPGLVAALSATFD